MNNIIIIIVLIILIVIIINKYNRKEPFMTEREKKILNQCFSDEKMNTFKKYEKYSKKYILDNSIVFVTPVHIINEIQSISNNGNFINNMCTNSQMRRKGIATKLLKRVLEDTKKEGKDHCILQVYSDNTPAVNLYKKIGFKIDKIFISTEKRIVYNMVHYL